VTKLSTITDPFKGVSSMLPVLELKDIVMKYFYPKIGKPFLRVTNILNLTTAGPNNPISSLSAPFDAYALVSNSELFK